MGINCKFSTFAPFYDAFLANYNTSINDIDLLLRISKLVYRIVSKHNDLENHAFLSQMFSARNGFVQNLVVHMQSSKSAINEKGAFALLGILEYLELRRAIFIPAEKKAAHLLLGHIISQLKGGAAYCYLFAEFTIKYGTAPLQRIEALVHVRQTKLGRFE